MKARYGTFIGIFIILAVASLACSLLPTTETIASSDTPFTDNQTTVANATEQASPTATSTITLPTTTSEATETEEIVAQSSPPVTITGQVFADNNFQLWVNGELVAEDPIEFTPHNVVSVSFETQYPITYAIRAVDFADPVTGLEYDNTKIGDGGLIATFSDGTVTNQDWHCIVVFSAPINRECLNNDPANTCNASYKDVSEDWIDTDFDDSAWTETVIFPESVVRPHGDFQQYNWGPAEFIWTADLEIDNTILCRIQVDDPATSK